MNVGIARALVVEVVFTAGEAVAHTMVWTSNGRRASRRHRGLRSVAQGDPRGHLRDGAGGKPEIVRSRTTDLPVHCPGPWFA